jgi:hypothetical protein
MPIVPQGGMVVSDEPNSKSIPETPSDNLASRGILGRGSDFGTDMAFRHKR